MRNYSEIYFVDNLKDDEIDRDALCFISTIKKIIPSLIGKERISIINESITQVNDSSYQWYNYVVQVNTTPKETEQLNADFAAHFESENLASAEGSNKVIFQFESTV